MILLDTDICIEVLRKNENIINKRAQYDDATAVSFMSVAELYYGAERSSNTVKNRFLIEEFLLTIEIIHTDIEILKKFGELKEQLYKENFLLPDADIFIAATTYVKADKLITGNTKHFQRFPNLVIENWQ
ncbi:MAG: type II toxin-antitoxin system VapC family toxin [Spirochaetota bacterium]